MKKYTHLLCLFSLIFAAPFAVADHHGEEKHSPLEEEMSAMNKAWRKVRRGVSDASKNAETIELVGEMIKSAEKGLKMEPTLLAEQKDDAAKKKFLHGYQEGMKGTIKLLGELKAALEKGDNAKAEGLVDKLNDARKEGHEAYKPKDDD